MTAWVSRPHRGRTFACQQASINAWRIATAIHPAIALTHSGPARNVRDNWRRHASRAILLFDHPCRQRDRVVAQTPTGTAARRPTASPRQRFARGLHHPNGPAAADGLSHRPARHCPRQRRDDVAPNLSDDRRGVGHQRRHTRRCVRDTPTAKRVGRAPIAAPSASIGR